MLERLIEYLKDNVINAGVKLLVAIVIVVAGFYGVKLFMKLLKKGRMINRIDPSAKTFILNFVGIALKVVILLTAAAYLGVPMTSMVAVLGSAGLALGLALQGGLTNLASGIIILLFKPFSVGDYVTFDGITGTIKSIGVFYTVIRTDSNCRNVYPNSVLTGKEISNHTAEPTRRIEFSFSVDYSSNVETVKNALVTAAQKNKYIIDEPAPFAYMEEHADSAIVFRLFVWCATQDYWPVVFSIKEDVKNAFDENEISIPFPQMDIHFDGDAPEKKKVKKKVSK